MLFLLESKRLDIWSLKGKIIETISLDGSQRMYDLVYSSYYDRIFVLHDNNITIINPYTFGIEKTYSLSHYGNIVVKLAIDNSGNFFAIDYYDTVYVMKNE